MSTEEQTYITDEFVTAMRDTADAAAHKNGNNTGYSFQYGYTLSTIERLLVDLNLNKRQLKMLQNETAKLKRWEKDYEKVGG